MAELNELGILLQERIERKRRELDPAIGLEWWSECQRIEAAITTLELVWMDLMRRNLLTK